MTRGSLTDNTCTMLRDVFWYAVPSNIVEMSTCCMFKYMIRNDAVLQFMSAADENASKYAFGLLASGEIE
jgi:hypothetical protein